MPYAPALITIVALILFQVLTFNVGRARGKFGVKAPATTGPEAFERRYRAQVNTLEQLVIFIPAVWLFFAFAPTYYADVVGNFLGAAWIIGRILYARGYYQEARKRTPGFVISMLASSLLLLGGLIGLLMQISKSILTLS